MRRIQAPAESLLTFHPPASFDLVFTSPPAYPSLNQKGGVLGTEPDLESYAQKLAGVLLKCRRVLKRGGFLVLVIEPVPGFDPMKALEQRFKRLQMPILATYLWMHVDGYSWVIFFGKGPEAHLNRVGPWHSATWVIPRPPPDAEYGFYEWPKGLVENVTLLTIPNGGRILDPFAGKASALAKLEAPFEVVAMDVKHFDDSTPNSEEGGVDALENPRVGRREHSAEEVV